MHLLAIETTDAAGSAALCEDDKILAFCPLDPERRSAQSLAPAISDLLTQAEWKPTDVDVVAVATGPGSFTGLRVGVATAKMFAWSVGAKIVSVDSLDAIAFEADRSRIFSKASGAAVGCVLSVGIDAQRGDAVVRDYWVANSGSSEDRFPKRLTDCFELISIDRWLSATDDEAWNQRAARLAEKANCATVDRNETIFWGPALDRVKELTTRFPELRFDDRESRKPTAKGVAFVALAKIARGDFDDVWSILPVYSRRAAAEERALEKANRNGGK